MRPREKKDGLNKCTKCRVQSAVVYFCALYFKPEKGYIMLIGFTHNTSKILPKIFCRRFRHCAIIQSSKCKVQSANMFAMYQFVRYKKIVAIPISMAGLKVLKKHGWVFIKINQKLNFELCNLNFVSCVGMVKRALGIRNPFIQTPDALYRYITKKPVK